jgi:hypothetical protein
VAVVARFSRLALHDEQKSDDESAKNDESALRVVVHRFRHHDRNLGKFLIF